MRAVAVALALLGCSESTCPTTAVEVRPFEGEPVMGTHTECPTLGGPLCGNGSYGQPTVMTLAPACGGERVALLGQVVGYVALIFVFDAPDRAPRVRASTESECDDDGCERHVSQVKEGWIMIEAHGGGREAGRFGLRFASLTISGDYDTTAWPDAGVRDGRGPDAN